MFRFVRAAAAAIVLAAPLVLALGAGPAASTPTYEVSDSIPLSSSPSLIAVDSANHRAYVPSDASSTVSVIDTSSHTVLRTLGTVGPPSAITLWPDSNTLFVATARYGEVDEVDTRTGSVIRSSNPGETRSLAFDPATQELYAAVGSTVAIIDTDAPGRQVSTVGVDGDAFQVEADPDLGRVYVTSQNNDGSQVAALDTTTHAVVGVVRITERQPYGIALDPTTHRLYVLYGNGSVRVIDTQRFAVTAQISFGTEPEGIAVDENAKVAYVTTDYGQTKVLDLTTNTIRATVPQGGFDVGVDTSTHEAFVTKPGNSVGVISTRGASPQDITVSGLSTGTHRVGRSEELTATGGASGNPVTFTLDPGTTNNACTVSDHGDSTATLSFQHIGTCIVYANQAGTSTYDPATPRRLQLKVDKGVQTVSFTSAPPRPARVDSSYEISVTASPTGRPVTFTSVTPAVCDFDRIDPSPSTGTTSTARLRFLAPGKCVVGAQQKGSTDYQQSTRAKQVIKVTG